MQPILSHTRIDPSGAHRAKWLYVLHGIFGSGRNWASIARRLAAEREGWGIVLADLRLHGGSQGFAPPHTVRACAEDLLQLEQHLRLRATALLGHSFGGKVGLLRSAHSPALAQVWVADSTLRTGEPSGSAWRVVEIVRGLPDRFGSREELVAALIEHGYDPAMGQWLAMNLERDDDGFRWRLDWEGVEQMLRDYFATDVWGMVENPSEPTAVHIVRATESSAVDALSVDRVRAAGARNGRVHLHDVAAGHWLNVDNPEAVLELLVANLP